MTLIRNTLTHTVYLWVYANDNYVFRYIKFNISDARYFRGMEYAQNIQQKELLIICIQKV